MLTAGVAALSSLAGSNSGSDIFTVNYVRGMYSEGCRKNSEGCVRNRKGAERALVFDLYSCTETT